jgi:mono/diheme cytochrome c family protein
MLGLIVIILLTLTLLSYAAIPLLFPNQADRLPSDKDPLFQDLEEERDALFRAIRELELRDDLVAERRDSLRARYEAKAAKVLRSLDERQSEIKGDRLVEGRQETGGRRQEGGGRRVPYGLLGLLGVMTVTALVLSNYVFPRVGNASVTASAEDLKAGKELQRLQQAVEKDTSQENLLELAEAYWQLNDSENAKLIYDRVVQQTTPVPAIAFQRLGFLSLQTDLSLGQEYLEKANALEPSNLDTLYTLSEVYFATGDVPQAIKTLETFLATPEGKDDAQAQQRLEIFNKVSTAAQAAQADPSEINLMALADTYWQVEERERAADIYINVLSQMNPHNADALSRVGQVLFFSGKTEDAVDLLKQAKEVDAENLDTLLFLGNAYFSLNQHKEAIDSWEDYVTVAGGPEKAGRVPSLIESAKARLSGEADPNAVTVSAEQVFNANCALCHGAQGQGGSGPALSGNPRALDAANVQNAIQYGRGAMPGFSATLSTEQIEALVKYVTEGLQ